VERFLQKLGKKQVIGNKFEINGVVSTMSIKVIPEVPHFFFHHNSSEIDD